MIDFNLKIYQSLLESLLNQRYEFQTFKSYMLNENSKAKIIILRHDVDLKPCNADKTSKIESQLSINGTYNFRIIPESFKLDIIEKIANLGHEIGYHYEDVDLVLKSQKSKVKSQNGAVDEEKLIDLAYESFSKNLKIFKKNFDIKTICMHGSPLSKYDNKIIWEKYNYKDLGLIGEPYFDIDWNEFAYLTDTGRRWNAAESSVRDKVNSKFNFNFKSTQEIIRNIKLLPDRLMITVHPQRWNDKYYMWMQELVFQNIKNVVKKSLVILRN